MAEKRSAKPGKGEPKPARAEVYATVRVYAEEGQDLVILAAMEGMTVAELYHEACAEIIRQRRLRTTEVQLAQMKSEQRK